MNNEKDEVPIRARQPAGRVTVLWSSDMRLLISGATTSLERFAADPAISAHVGHLWTPATGNRLSRVCSTALPWAADNAAFGTQWDTEAFEKAAFFKIPSAPTRPLFITVPDVVGDGRATLGLFLTWHRLLLVTRLPLALVLQDGAEDQLLPWELFSWVFVGGSRRYASGVRGKGPFTEWKESRAAADLIREARRRGKRVHAGRVNGLRRLRHFHDLRVDTADGSSRPAGVGGRTRPRPHGARLRRGAGELRTGTRPEVPGRARRPIITDPPDPHEDYAMTPLDALPVPPQLEAAVGYTGDARWLSLCWTACGDTVLYDDGRAYGTGHGWGYLGFARSPAVAPYLRGLDLGSSERDGTQRLVIDRVERRAYSAANEEARRVVRDQWPAEPEVELTPEQWEAVVDEVRQRLLSRPLPTAADLLRQMREHGQLVAEMVRYLDRHAGGGSE